MDILTSGCSFTSLYHPENRTKKPRPQFPKTQKTWSDFLYKKGHNTINIGVPTNSNTNIVRGLIFHGNKMLSGQRHPRGYYKCTTVPKTAKFHKQVERTSSGGGAAEERYLITYYGDRDILDALYRRLQSESSRGTAKIGSILSTRR